MLKLNASKISRVLAALLVITAAVSAIVPTVLMCEDGDNCEASNRTRYDNVGSNEPTSNDTVQVLSSTAIAEVTEDDKPAFWCPENFQAMKRGGTFFRMCRPLSCVNVSREEVANLTEQGASVFHEYPASTEASVTVSASMLVCNKLNEDFTGCPKRILSASQFRQVSGGRIQHLLDGTLSGIGDHFRRGDVVVVCDPTNGSQKAESMIEPCQPHQVVATRLQVLDNRGAVVAGIDSSIIAGHYRLDAVGDYADVCFAMSPSFISCGRATDSGTPVLDKADDIRVDPDDLSLVMVVDSEESTYRLGNYVLAQNVKAAIVCLVTSSVEYPLILFGVLGLVSAIFVLLSLVAHFWIPKLNYHKIALLCLLASMLVMYLAFSVRCFLAFGRNEKGARLLVLFVVQYTSGLASFFWLNVLSFDLWRQYSNPTGILNQGSKQGNKRRFLLKCGYAWGVPLLMCALILIINGNEGIQDALEMQIHLAETGWFYDVTGILVFFHGPIGIIFLANGVFFTLTVVNIKKWSKGISIVNKKIHSQLLALFVRLFIVVGICWLFEVISFAFASKTVAAFYFTDAVNLLQGVLISLVYVFKRTTIKLLRVKFCESSAGRACLFRLGINKNQDSSTQIRPMATSVSRPQLTMTSSLNQQKSIPKENTAKFKTTLTPAIEHTSDNVRVAQDGGDQIV